MGTVANERHEKDGRQNQTGFSKHKLVQRLLQWDNLCANAVMDRQDRTFLFSINTPTLLYYPTLLFISMSNQNISALVKQNAQLGLWLNHRRLCLQIDENNRRLVLHGIFHTSSHVQEKNRSSGTINVTRQKVFTCVGCEEFLINSTLGEEHRSVSSQQTHDFS